MYTSKDLKKKSDKLQIVVDILKKNNLITDTISLGEAKFMVIILDKVYFYICKKCFNPDLIKNIDIIFSFHFYYLLCNYIFKINNT